MLLGFILIYPGAFVRWLFGGCKKPYKDYLNPSFTEINSFIGALLLTIVAVIIASFRDIIEIN